MRLLLTGARGFIGRAVCRAALARNLEVHATSRELPSAPESGVTYFATGPINRATDWAQALAGCEAVIHLAGAVHLPPSTPAADYQRVNVEATQRLLVQAAQADVRRFVYVSSIAVLGNHMPDGTLWHEQTPPAPESAYARSKLEAEQQVQSLAAQYGMEWVIARPPAVYGTHAPGTVRQLTRLARLGLPLPFARIRNQRSFISVQNLSSALLACATHPASANQLFLVSDGVDFSTPDFARFLAQAERLKLRLFGVPEPWLRALLIALGQSRIAQSLCDSLRIDITKIRTTLGWQPVPPGF